MVGARFRRGVGGRWVGAVYKVERFRREEGSGGRSGLLRKVESFRREEGWSERFVEEGGEF